MFEVLGSGIAAFPGIDAVFSILDAAAGQVTAFEETDLYRLVVIILVWISGIIVILFPEIHPRTLEMFHNAASALKTVIRSFKGKNGTDDDSLDAAITAAGYDYDPKQDIFYSRIDAWQRNMGYCRLYDEAAAPLNMIIDCEPIYFNYGGKRWLIEFWKGQYGMTTGCELGIYMTDKPDISIPGVFKGPFFECVGNEDMVKMKCTLIKNNKTLFKREGRHWWLTGFILGEFSEPWELNVDLSVTLKNVSMRNAFVKGLKDAGYKDREIKISGNTVSLKFDKPRTPQPVTRIAQTDWVIQRKNKLLCDMYKDITGQYDNFHDKMKAMREMYPEIYEKMFDIGKTKKIFEMFKLIKKYLDD